MGATVPSRHRPVKLVVGSGAPWCHVFRVDGSRIALCLTLALGTCAPAVAHVDGAGGAGERPLFADALWDDGLAEVASYDVRERRYGTLRDATATMIVVKETFDADALVKDDGPERAERTIDVMKLNHVLTVPTGVYTYRQMASVFVTRDRAQPVERVIGSQEWCGITHKRLAVRGGRATLHASSYFGGEGERSFDVPMDDRTVLYDALPLWLRTLELERRHARRVRLVSQQLSNRAPRPELAEATITVGAPRSIVVPAGTREVVPVTVEHAAGTDVLSFAREAPHPLVRWDRADGGSYALRGVRRVAYWELHDLEDVGALGPDPEADLAPGATQ